MPRESIFLQIPADTSYVSLVRTATLSFAARLEFPIDQLEELSHAAHEMTTLLLEDTPGTRLIDIRFDTVDPVTVAIIVSSQTRRGKVPRQDSFAWTILNALVDKAHATAVDGLVTITAQRTVQQQNKPIPTTAGGPAPDGRTGAAH